MKRTNKIKIAMWIFAVAPLMLTAIVYSRLPDQIPTHWDINGDVTYGSKASLWLLSSISPALAIMFTILPKIDPRKKNYDKFIGQYDGFALVMMIFMLGLVALTVSESLNPGNLSVEFAVVAACGLLFVYLGNMMPKIKSNFFFGIKTPWALSNSEVWNKTHRLAGYLYFFGGMFIIVFAFFIRGYALYMVMMASVAVMSIVPAVMSYVWFRRQVDNKNALD